MIDGLKLARTLLENQPENAQSLWEFFVWARSDLDDPVHEAQADQVETFIYSQTELCEAHKESDRQNLYATQIRAATSGS